MFKGTRAVILGGVLLAWAGAVHAQTPAQVRQVAQAMCDRTAAAYARRDLPGFMALYAHGYRGTNVTGRTADYLDTQAGIARELADRTRAGSSRCSVGAVTLSGGQAHATLTWHYDNRHGGAVPYTFVRDYVAQSSWVRADGGWRLAREQMLRDTMTYRK